MQQELRVFLFASSWCCLKSVRKVLSRQFPLRGVFRRWERGKIGKWEEMQFARNKKFAVPVPRSRACAGWLEQLSKQRQLFVVEILCCSHSTPRALLVCFHFAFRRKIRNSGWGERRLKIRKVYFSYFVLTSNEKEILHAAHKKGLRRAWKKRKTVCHRYHIVGGEDEMRNKKSKFWKKNHFACFDCSELSEAQRHGRN